MAVEGKLEDFLRKNHSPFSLSQTYKLQKVESWKSLLFAGMQLDEPSL